MKVISHECVGKDCFDDIAPEAECVDEIRSWSNPKDWDPEKDVKLRVEKPIPGAGETFKIPTGWNMELDLKETPIFDTIEINGCLHFKDAKDLAEIHLKAKKILIRGGELYIGKKNQPF